MFAATQEKFVPQMLNLEVLGGVDFKKGCYPGQEVVARSQYLGKLKRRMSVAHVDIGNGADISAGADIFHSDGIQPIGSVVMAATASQAPAASCYSKSPIDRLESGTVHLQAPDGPQVIVRPLTVHAVRSDQVAIKSGWSIGMFTTSVRRMLLAKSSSAHN